MNEADLRRASERVTQLYKEAEEKIETVTNGYNLVTIGGIGRESDIWSRELTH